MGMAQIVLLCFILADAFLGLAMANQNVKTMNTIPFSNSYNAQAPISRKLGRHHHHKMVYTLAAPSISPSIAPEAQVNRNPTGETPAATNNEETGGVKGLKIHLLSRHHSVDKSIAGGGVILAGLAATFLSAVFCYIRATRRLKAETTS